MVGSCPVVHGRGNSRNATGPAHGPVSAFLELREAAHPPWSKRQSATLPRLSLPLAPQVQRALGSPEAWEGTLERRFVITTLLLGPACADYKALLCPSCHHGHARQGAQEKMQVPKGGFLPSITGLEPRTAKAQVHWPGL